MADLKAQPLLHEDKQIGYLVKCPNCGAGIRVPIFELLMAQPADTWRTPPQNTALAEGGWYHAWGSENEPTTLHLRFPAPSRGEPQPGDEQRIVCREGCGQSLAIVRGQIEPRG